MSVSYTFYDMTYFIIFAPLYAKIFLKTQHSQIFGFILTWKTLLNTLLSKYTLCYASNTSIVFQLQNWWFQNSWSCLFTKKVCLPSPAFSLTRYFLVIFKIMHWKQTWWQCTCNTVYCISLLIYNNIQGAQSFFQTNII
jgi:hypothetical protein